MKYRDKGIKTDDSISSPAESISKRSQRQEKWHVLNTLGFDHQFLHQSNKQKLFYQLSYLIINKIYFLSKKIGKNFQIRQLTMTAKGAAYIIILPTMQMLPTIEDLNLVVWARVSTRRTKTAMKIISPSIIIKTLILFFLSEYRMNRDKNTISITNPVPLIVTTRVLWGWTNGSP